MDILGFKNLYHEVFDLQGNVTPCGRAKCIELINKANDIKPGNYGDVNTGIMNIENIKSLYQKLFTSDSILDIMS